MNTHTKRLHYIEGISISDEKFFTSPLSFMNKHMKPVLSSQNEIERLISLKRLAILDTPPEERFDRITKLAAKIFNMPVSAITLVDSNRVWFKSMYGLDVKEEDRATSFCGRAAFADEVLVVLDAKKDKRFSHNPMVIGKPFLRFYAGAPLFSVDGQKIGTFSVKDTKPRLFSHEDVKTLETLARWSELEINNQDLSLAIESVKKRTFELDSFFDLSEDLICVVDSRGCFERINSNFSEMFGYIAPEMVGEPLLRFVVPEDVDSTAKQLKNIEKGMAIINFKNRLLKKDGGQVWLEWNAVPQDGHFYAIARDVTPDIERQIQTKFYTSILRNSNDAIISEDLKGVVTSWNEAAESMYGYSGEEMIGRSVRVVIPEGSDDVERKLGDIKKGIAVGNFETIRKRKDGTFLNVSLSVSPITGGDDDHVIGASIIARDITREKEIDSEKTEFVSLASHQLKTPVGAMGWHLEMFQDGDYGLLSPKQKEAVLDMYKLNRRMNDLINGLLNISRIDMGVFVVDLTLTNWGAVCDEVLLDFESQIVIKNQHIFKEYGDGLKSVLADQKLLRIILQNYISNAIKYSPNNGEISITIHVVDTHIVIKVMNNGDSIPARDKTKIFSKLFRAGNAQKQDQDGNGLGLYIVKKIAESCCGTVWFESEKGEETVFYASFPTGGMCPSKIGDSVDTH